MKRRDYILIAEALKQADQTFYNGMGADHFVEALADALQADNPNGFDRDMFLKNAGVQTP